MPATDYGLLARFLMSPVQQVADPYTPLKKGLMGDAGVGATEGARIYQGGASYRRLIPAIKQTSENGSQVYANTPDVGMAHSGVHEAILAQPSYRYDPNIKSESGWLDLQSGTYYPRNEVPSGITGKSRTSKPVLGGAKIVDYHPDWVKGLPSYQETLNTIRQFLSAAKP